VASIKAAVRAGEEAPLSSALAQERQLFRLLFDSLDQKEGMNAFLERRAPAFVGR
jgi:enoyl-CoA hydratase/carnithine racemase